MSDVRRGDSGKQPAPVSAAGHPEDHHSDQVGPGEGHAGNVTPARRIKHASVFPISMFTSRALLLRLLLLCLRGRNQIKHLQACFHLRDTLNKHVVLVE